MYLMNYMWNFVVICRIKMAIFRQRRSKDCHLLAFTILLYRNLPGPPVAKRLPVILVALFRNVILQTIHHLLGNILGIIHAKFHSRRCRGMGAMMWNIDQSSPLLECYYYLPKSTILQVCWCVCYLPKSKIWQVCSFNGLSVCLSVCLFVLDAITEKRFKISSPNLVHMCILVRHICV